ncbi:Outer membrane protein [Phocaeicola vulgatus]|nr:Outer membrane protein [Phocaeicola vulgatus]
MIPLVLNSLSSYLINNPVQTICLVSVYYNITETKHVCIIKYFYVFFVPVSLSAQNGELSLTLEQSASLMNKGSRTLQMADKAVDIARSERQKMNAFWYPSLNASGAYVHLSNHIEVKEPLRQFTDPAKDFVHSIVPDDKFISSILDNIGAHTLTFPLLERNLTTIDANVMWPLFTGGKRIFASRIGNRMVDLAKAGRKRRELLCNRSWWKLIMLCVWRKEWWMYASKPF